MRKSKGSGWWYLTVADKINTMPLLFWNCFQEQLKKAKSQNLKAAVSLKANLWGMPQYRLHGVLLGLSSQNCSLLIRFLIRKHTMWQQMGNKNGDKTKGRKSDQERQNSQIELHVYHKGGTAACLGHRARQERSKASCLRLSPTFCQI